VGTLGPRGVVVVLAVAVLLGACGTNHDPVRATTTEARSNPTDPSVTSGTAPAAPTTPSLSAVGGVIHTAITLVDPTRGTVARPPVPASSQRVLRTTIRRPASGAGPWPLVVFGHGFDISADAYATLLDSIARAGFVVAAPEFPGSSTALPGQPDEHDVDAEPCDLRFVADRVQAASTQPGELAGIVRPGPIALAGQSDGATAAAFATLVPAACPGPAVTSVVAFSAKPVAGTAIDPTVAAARPALLAVTGSADTVNPASNTETLYRQWPGPAWLLTSLGDSHLGPSTDSPRHTTITAVVIDFLRATLGADPMAEYAIAADAHLAGLTLAQR